MILFYQDGEVATRRFRTSKEILAQAGSSYNEGEVGRFTMAANPVVRVTPEEYLAAERTAEFKSEYFDGLVYAMSGGSLRHGQLGSNFIRQLGNALTGKPCLVYTSDVRVRATKFTYAYPDISVVCGQPLAEDSEKDVLLNPIVIVEVLSPSTEANDRGLKFARYRRLESLADYVLVSQDEPKVEVFRRQPKGAWLFFEYAGLDAVCVLDSIGCAIPLSSIYEKIEFAAEIVE